MEEEVKSLKKKNNRLKAIIVILIFTLVLAGIIVFIFCCCKKEDVKPVEKQQEEKKEDQKEVYHVVDGEKFDVYGKTPGEETELTKRNQTISFVYPVIDIDSEDAKIANEKIKKVYDTAYQNNLNAEADKNACIAIKKDGKYYGGSHISSISYDVTNNDKFIAITLIGREDTECAGGYKSYSSFVIDKTTKKAMTNKELVTHFGADETKIISLFNRDADTFGNEKANTIEEVDLVIIDGVLNVVQHGNGDSVEPAK